MRKIIPGSVALAALALTVAACGSATPSSGAEGGTAPSEAPLAAVTWQPGGAWAGPVPAGWPLPGPHGSISLDPYTTGQGYTSQVTLGVGVPLHFAVPQDLINCNTADPGRVQDLDPGHYVIPFTLRVRNLTHQESPALVPVFTANTSSDTASDPLSMTGIDNYESSGVWAGGECSEGIIKHLAADGTEYLSGFIGPATAGDLENAWITANWDPNGNTAPVMHRALAQLLPHKINSWLIAHS